MQPERHSLYTLLAAAAVATTGRLPRPAPGPSKGRLPSDWGGSSVGGVVVQGLLELFGEGVVDL